MMNEETKTCPACAEQIKRAAKICPRCRQWQRIWSIRSPVIWCSALVAGIVAIGVCLFIFFERIINPGPDFSSFRGQIVVTGSKVRLQQTERDRSAVVVGFVTNQSAFAWKDMEFECRFFDTKGELIDARTHIARMTILGHDETAFRTEIKLIRPLDEYVSHQVVVRSARNAKAFP